MNTTFTIRPDGSIALPDDDGDPAYYLSADQAFELERFIAERRDDITAAAAKAQTVSTYARLASLVAAGLPAPQYTRTTWDGVLVVEMHSEDDYVAWVECLEREDGVNAVEDHPTLGRRTNVTSHGLRVQSDWVKDAEQVSA